MTLKKINRYLNHGLWQIRLADVGRPKFILLKVLRIFILSLKEFNKDKCVLRASALTYYTLLSIVPVFAMGFGIAKGFEMDNKLKAFILEKVQTKTEAANPGDKNVKAVIRDTGPDTAKSVGSAGKEVEVLIREKEVEILIRDKVTTATGTAGTGEGAAGNNFQEEVVGKVIEFADKLLGNVKGGIIAGFGVIMILWITIKVLGNIEKSFNDIWGIKKSRTLMRKFGDYLAFVLVSPILFIMASSMTLYLEAKIAATARPAVPETKIEAVSPSGDLTPPEPNGADADGSPLGSFTESEGFKDLEEGIFAGSGPWGWLGMPLFFLLKLVPFGLLCGLFTFTYIFIPNTKVHFSSALMGGVIAAGLFQLIQWVYLECNVGVAKYSAIYSGFAALPLFLVWLQTSWLVALYGAELSFAYQNVDTYEFEPDSLAISPGFKKLITLGIVHRCVRAFDRADEAPTALALSRVLQCPIRLTRQILHELVRARVLSEVKGAQELETGYQPARNIENMSVKSVLNQLDLEGATGIPVASSPELLELSKVLQDLQNMELDSDVNRKIKDI